MSVIYLYWIERYGAYTRSCNLPWTAGDSVRAFLGDLAIHRRVSSSTQNQAFNALLFLLREVLGQDDVRLDAVRAKSGYRSPTVLSEKEVGQVLSVTEGTAGLMLRL